MLNEQITKITDCLEIILSEIADIKNQSETKGKAAYDLGGEIQNYLHLLEADEDISDELAAKYGKLIAEKRRKRREYDNYVKSVDPLTTYLAKNENAWNELRLAVKRMKEMQEAIEAPVYIPRAEEAQPEAKVGNVQFGGNDWKQPRPILATTAGGLKILFNSIAAASRAFLYSSGEIVSCAKGFLDNIDGDTFTFVTEEIHDPSVKTYYHQKAALILELNIREQRKRHERHQQELIAAAAGRPAKSQTEKFAERMAKTEEKQNAPEKKGIMSPKPLRRIAENGEIVEYPSAAAAAKELGVSPSAVTKAIYRGGKCQGFRWEYI